MEWLKIKSRCVLCKTDTTNIQLIDHQEGLIEANMECPELTDRHALVDTTDEVFLTEQDRH
jgi:hypothetical protein